jgi:hypothetical protein
MPASDRGIRAHVLALPRVRRVRAEQLAPKVDTPTRLANQTPVGSTQHFTVSSDGSADGNASAQAVLQTCEKDFTQVTSWFGGLQLPPGQDGNDQTTVRTALPIQVAMDANAGGAYHYACDGTDIFIQPVPSLAEGLVVAELVEVFEAAQNRGWDCGQTNGEGLSRVLAGEVSPGLGQDFVDTINTWWNSGHNDYVNDNSATDQDQSSNGCATVFLFYLHSQLNFTWQQIVAAGASTLGGTYQQLTNKDPQAGFQDFLDRLATVDNGSGLTLPANGNPFPISGTATPRKTGGGLSSTAILIGIGVLAVIAIIVYFVFFANGGH